MGIRHHYTAELQGDVASPLTTGPYKGTLECVGLK